MKTKVMVGLVLLLCFSGFSFAEGKKDKNAADTQVIKLKLAHETAPSNPRHKAALFFADMVAKESNGKIQITVYDSGQLGDERKTVEALAVGGLDMCLAGSAVFASYAPALELLDMPYLFSTYDKAYEVVDGAIGKKLIAPLKNNNIEILAFWENGFRHITNNKGPINKPEDLVGLKIRTAQNKIRMETFKAYGSIPVPIAFTELYIALSQGVVDGQENPISNITSAKFQEVQKYLSLTGHVYSSLPFAVSAQVWKKMPDDAKSIIVKAAIEASKYHRTLVQKEDNSAIDELKKGGMKVNAIADIRPFQAKAKVVWDLYRQKFGNAAVDEVLQAAGVQQ